MICAEGAGTEHFSALSGSARMRQHCAFRAQVAPGLLAGRLRKVIDAFGGFP